MRGKTDLRFAEIGRQPVDGAYIIGGEQFSHGILHRIIVLHAVRIRPTHVGGSVCRPNFGFYIPKHYAFRSKARPIIYAYVPALVYPKFQRLYFCIVGTCRQSQFLGRADNRIYKVLLYARSSVDHHAVNIHYSRLRGVDYCGALFRIGRNPNDFAVFVDVDPIQAGFIQ